MFMPVQRCLVCCLLAFTLFFPANQVFAQDSGPDQNHWVFRTRAVMSGTSDESEPPGYKVYSGVGIEAEVGRKFGRHLAADISLRTESREVDREVSSGPADRLGSLELLPITLTIKYQPPLSGRMHPYIGLGANMSAAWEKSGVLDSLDIGAHFGPAIQLGFDYDLTETAVFNVNLGWNTYTADIEINGGRFAEMKIDPIAIGLGVGFRF